MKSRGYALLALAVALCLAGCKSSSPPPADAAPAAADAASGSDLGPDGNAVLPADSAWLPDEPAAPDTGGPEAAPDLRPAEPDASGREAAPDLRPAEVAPPDSTAGAETPGADRPAVEDQTSDRRGADLGADSFRPETTSADAPAADAAKDAGCTGWTALQRISPAEAKTLIETSDPIVINVHIPYEGDIPGTDASIPYDDVDAIEAYLKYDHCADVLLVCKSGGMSLSAGNELIKRGYLRMRDLSGGFLAWQAAGYPLLMDGGV